MPVFEKLKTKVKAIMAKLNKKKKPAAPAAASDAASVDPTNDISPALLSEAPVDAITEVPAADTVDTASPPIDQPTNNDSIFAPVPASSS